MGHEREMVFSDLFRLAREAGCCVRTEDRRGKDGLIYTAFWLEDPAES